MRTLLSLLVLSLVAPVALSGQEMVMEPSLTEHWYSIIEIPALLVAVIFGFLTAKALRGGRLGVGMQLIAWGFLVMAIGHLHMQGDAIFGFNLFNVLFGATGGHFVWIVALLVTWTLTGMGFFRLYQASNRV